MLDHPELLPDLPERLDGPVEVGALVRRGDLAAQARLALGHDGEAEAGDVDALLEERLAHRERLRRVADDDGHDRMRAVGDPEARISEIALRK